MLGGIKDIGKFIYEEMRAKLQYQPSSPASPQGLWPKKPQLGETFPKSADGLSRADVFQAVVDSNTHDMKNLREFIAASDKNATVGMLSALAGHGMQIAGAVAGSVGSPLVSAVLLGVGTGLAVGSYCWTFTHCFRRDDVQMKRELLSAVSDVHREAAAERKQEPVQPASASDFQLAREWATRE